MGRRIHKIMSERYETLEHPVLAGILKDLKAVEKSANDYFESIKDFIAKVNNPGFKSTPADVRLKAEINFKDTNFQVDRQELVDKMKPIVIEALQGKLAEYEEAASVEPKEGSETEVVVKIIDVLEEFKAAYAAKNAKPEGTPSPYAGETVA